MLKLSDCEPLVLLLLWFWRWADPTLSDKELDAEAQFLEAPCASFSPIRLSYDNLTQRSGPELPLPTKTFFSGLSLDFNRSLVHTLPGQTRLASLHSWWLEFDVSLQLLSCRL